MAQDKKANAGRYRVAHSLVDSFQQGTVIDLGRHLPRAAEDPNLLNRLVSLGAIERVDDDEAIEGQTDVYGDPIQVTDADFETAAPSRFPSLATGADVPADDKTRATIDEKAVTGDMTVKVGARGK